MNPNNPSPQNQNIPPQAPVQPSPQAIPQTPPVYHESTTQKVMRETAEATAAVGIVGGLIATIKNIFRK